MTSTKTITRLYCEGHLKAAETVVLSAGATHKLRAVLRAQIGDELLLFNTQNGEWRAELVSLGKNKAEAVCREQTRMPQQEPGPWLAFAPLKKDRLDQIVEKAVELGAERLIPVITARTENRRLRMERLNQQIVDAAEQCERLSVPALSDPVLLSKLGDVWPQDRTLLVAAERQDAPPLAQAVQNADQPLGIIIGPEGGFEPQELDGLLNLPISVPINLGPRILRAETAAISALGIIQAISGDWQKD
ncbi:16S rRNA (uracil(1498)-N(3))-methyltransferase [Magnetovibrio sp. PR-2]|uniref:16S rRNA (uracil(1498)-N(3))-methyltransferase n=1 Tax=Magnetovibrio sp. PR-2 TaxID=3120356 RepID=UPI002FCE45A9